MWEHVSAQTHLYAQRRSRKNEQERKVRCIFGKGGRYDMKVGKQGEKTGRFVEKVGKQEVKTGRLEVKGGRCEVKTGKQEVKEGEFRKKVHYFFDQKGQYSKNSNSFFKNYSIIRKKNIIFALDKTQLSPFLSLSDIDIVQYPWTILLWFSTNAL